MISGGMQRKDRELQSDVQRMICYSFPSVIEQIVGWEEGGGV